MWVKGSLRGSWCSRANRLSKNRPQSIFSGPGFSTVQGDRLLPLLKVSVGVEGRGQSGCHCCCFHFFFCSSIGYVVRVRGVSAGVQKIVKKKKFKRSCPCSGLLFHPLVVKGCKTGPLCKIKRLQLLFFIYVTSILTREEEVPQTEQLRKHAAFVVSTNMTATVKFMPSTTTVYMLASLFHITFARQLTS